MPETQTWRTLFRTIISIPERRQVLAHELGVNPVTLTRWAENQATPRLSSLQRLLKLLPEYQSLMLPLITQEFPSFTLKGTPEEAPEDSIPAAFYQQVVHMLVTLPDSRRVWETCRSILRQMVKQLDTDQTDIAVLLTQCVLPPAPNKVRSLRALMGAGKTPWGGNPEYQSAFLGIEMVAGQVVATGQSITIQNYPSQLQATSESTAGLGSSCTYPLLRANRILGTLGVLSALPDYFTPVRQHLIEDYAALTSIVFPSDMFFDFEAIELNILPPYSVQAPYLATLHARIQHLIKDAMKNNQPLTLNQAEQKAWQQLEDEVIHSAYIT